MLESGATTPASNVITGSTFTPGLYHYSGAVTFTAASPITITGNCGDYVVIQIGGSLTPAASTNVVLTGGITASTVYWIVAGNFVPGAGASFQGIVISAGGISLAASVSLTG